MIDGKSKTVSVPIVSIECKTYVDKTMLEGSIATAEKIKKGNPFSKFYILTEFYEVDLEVDISDSFIDNIFVLREGKSVDRHTEESINSIRPVTIEYLYKEVTSYLFSNWNTVRDNLENTGVMFQNRLT